MAEMDVSSGGGHKKGPGVKKGKKLSTRVDLTPMVDLGFLLITFFMFTTTLSKPKTMEINMPNKEKIEEKDQTKVKESVAFTVLLSREHRIYYYEGLASDPTKPPELKITYFKPKDGIRDAIIDKKKRIEEQRRQDPTLTAKDQLTVLIKPDANSTYEDLVNILDEMAINDVKIYAIVDITDVDREFIQSTEQANTGAQ
ncbi:MAG TPA: biopolymer transporter ExbD [Flavipsychrobacter sp.]|nr:biopolymer transporter ExbD [Flavipsychrobacter sp.]